MWSIAGLWPAMLHMKACWNPKGGHKPCFCLCSLIVFFSLCFSHFLVLMLFFRVFFFCYFLVGPKLAKVELAKLAKVGLAKVEIGQSRTKPWPKSELAKAGRAQLIVGKKWYVLIGLFEEKYVFSLYHSLKIVTITDQWCCSSSLDDRSAQITFGMTKQIMLIRHRKT